MLVFSLFASCLPKRVSKKMRTCNVTRIGACDVRESDQILDDVDLANRLAKRLGGESGSCHNVWYKIFSPSSAQEVGYMCVNVYIYACMYACRNGWRASSCFGPQHLTLSWRAHTD